LGSSIALCSHIARYCVSIFLADGMRELFWRFLVVTALLTIVSRHMAIRIDQFFLLASASIGIALVVQILALNVLCRRWVGLDPSILILFRKSPDQTIDAEPAYALGNRVNRKSHGQLT
jgi:hypothetical protein